MTARDLGDPERYNSCTRDGELPGGVLLRGRGNAASFSLEKVCRKPRVAEEVRSGEAKQEVKLVLFVLVHEGASRGGRRRIALIFRCQLAAVPFSLTCLSSFSCLATSPLLAVTQGLASLEAFWVEVPSRGAECGGMHCLFLLGFVTTKCCPTWMMIRGLEHFSYGKKPRVVVHPGEKIIL